MKKINVLLIIAIVFSFIIIQPVQAEEKTDDFEWHLGKASLSWDKLKLNKKRKRDCISISFFL